MKPSNFIKIKHCIINLSLAFSLLLGCTKQAKTPKEFVRFETALKNAQIITTDSIMFIYWTKHSCGGCRKKSIFIVSRKILPNKLKIISPSNYKDELMSLPENTFYIDEANHFSKKYFGIDNIGIVKVANNKVYFIKNYNPNEMAEFEKELYK